MGAVRVTLFTQAGRLERQWKEKETELVQLRQDAKSETDYLQDELLSMRASYEEKMKAYRDLFDLKIKLDQELETYHQILETYHQVLEVEENGYT